MPLPYSHWCLPPVARLRFLNHRQIHLWNFCSVQRRLIFMPTAHPWWNAFARFALGTSALRPEESNTSYAVNFCRSNEKARRNGYLSRRSRRLVLNNTLGFKLGVGVNVHNSYRIRTRICRQPCRTDWIRCDRHEETAESQWTTMYGSQRSTSVERLPVRLRARSDVPSIRW